MDIRHRILEFNNSPKYERLQGELDKLGAVYKIETLGSIGGKESRSIEFTVSENDPLFPVISELIEKHDFYAQTGVYYSQQDIEAAEWVYASVGEYQYPQPEDDFGYIEATYDTSDYCARCGMGAVQVRPFRLKRDFKQKSSRFLGLHWVHDEVFVRPEVKAVLEKGHISGAEFSHPVHHKSGEDIDSVYQMIIQTIAEPGLMTEGLSTVTCQVDNEESWIEGVGRVKNRLGDYPYCGRVKYHFPRTDAIKFRGDRLVGLPDIAKSHEHFGSGAAANRLVLMRNRVVKLVNEYKLRGLKFIPIEVV
jgi:hypothetical protein